MDLLGREILRTVQRQQIAAFVKGERFEGLSALQFVEDIQEQGTKHVGLNRIEDVSHLSVAGDVLDAVEVLHVLIVPSVLKGQQRRVFQGEHSEAREYGVTDGIVAVSFPGIGKLHGPRPQNVSEEGIEGESFSGSWNCSWVDHDGAPENAVSAHRVGAARFLTLAILGSVCKLIQF
jgi:hypothetical protein